MGHNNGMFLIIDSDNCALCFLLNGMCLFLGYGDLNGFQRLRRLFVHEFQVRLTLIRSVAIGLACAWHDRTH